MVGRVKDTSNDKGERGLASVTKLNDTNLRINFEESGNQVDFVVVEGNIPETFPFASMVANKSALLSLTLNKAADKILFVNPANGEFNAKFKQFVSPQNSAPAPETKKGKGGKEYRDFAALIEIADGRWKGTIFYNRFFSNFAKDIDGNLAVSGSGASSDALFDLLEATGVNSYTIPYSENPLPQIQKLAQEEDRVFKIRVIKGWIDGIIPPFNAEDDAFGGEAEVRAIVNDTSDDLNIDEVHPALKD